jgi:hypothetical protein
VSTLETHMQTEVRAWVASALVSPTAAPHVVREMILSRFVDLDGTPGGYRDTGGASGASDKRVD